MLIQAFAVALPVFSTQTGVVYSAAAMLGGTFMGIVGLTQMLARVPHPHGTSQRIARVTACYGIGQIVGPIIVGLWGREQDFSIPVLCAAGALVLRAGCFWISRSRERLEVVTT